MVRYLNTNINFTHTIVGVQLLLLFVQIGHYYSIEIELGHSGRVVTLDSHL